MIDESVVQNRLRLLPPIRRARLWRLYAEDRAAGRPWRFLDFWMDGGRSLLGAKGSGIGTAAKAAIDTGLTRPFPSIREARLERTLMSRYPGYAAVRFFRNESRAIAAATSILPEGEILPVIMPFAEYLAGTSGAVSQSVATPRLPCPPVLAPGLLLFEDAEEARAVEGELVPPLALSCAHRSLLELDRFSVYYSENLWKRTDRRLGQYFERRGPYLFPRPGGGDYDRLFTAALGAGVLLSPDPALPSIVPGDFDDGELAALAAALAAVPGKLT
ncbi:MAG: hypothetical protein ABSF43_11795 [Rectinemataceae bacterium]|jgi:hypothetical protein